MCTQARKTKKEKERHQSQQIFVEGQLTLENELGTTEIDLPSFSD